MLESEAEAFEDEDYNVHGLQPGQLFNKIFQLLDADKSGRVSKEEICAYFAKMVGDIKTEGEESNIAIGDDVNFKNSGEQEMQNLDKVE